MYNNLRFIKTKAGVLSIMGIPRREVPAGSARHESSERVFLMPDPVLKSFPRPITCKHERRSLHVAGSPCPHIQLLFRPGAPKRAHEMQPGQPLVGCRASA
jgi:hypothetical protein